MMNVPDIWDILEKEGYDCDNLSDDEWEEHNDKFEEECEAFLRSWIKDKQSDLAFEWASRLGLKKAEKKKKSKDSP